MLFLLKELTVLLPLETELSCVSSAFGPADFLLLCFGIFSRAKHHKTRPKSQNQQPQPPHPAALIIHFIKANAALGRSRSDLYRNTKITQKVLNCSRTNCSEKMVIVSYRRRKKQKVEECQKPSSQMSQNQQKSAVQDLHEKCKQMQEQVQLCVRSSDIQQSRLNSSNTR